MPLGRTTAPDVFTDSSAWEDWETGSLRLGIRVPMLRTSSLEAPRAAGRRLAVFVVRDDFLLARQTAATSRDRLDLSFEDLSEGEAEIIVKVYDAFGLLVGQGYTTATIRSGRIRSASVLVLPASLEDDDYPEWSDPEWSAPDGMAPPLPQLSPTPTPWFTLPTDPNRYFISQMFDSRWNPGAPTWTQNCGPTSLAMVLKAYNLLPPLLTSFADPQAVIRKTRRAMMGTEDDFQLSSLEDLERGASACGLFSERTYGLEGVREALDQGRLVILAGNPIAYNQRFAAGEYSGFDGGHFVLVTRLTSTQALLNDPLSRTGNISVTLSDLQRYMAYKSWNVGMSVYR